MAYKIVTMVEGVTITQEPKDIEFWADVCGVKILGYNKNPRQREELQGHPILDGFHGPMWDGGAIRYEKQQAFDFLNDFLGA